MKKRYSAFFGTELDELVARFSDPLVVAGINTHACVRMTVIHVYQRDLEVVVVGDDVASHDDEHDRITRRYLDGKIALFMDSDAIVAALDSEGSLAEMIAARWSEVS